MPEPSPPGVAETHLSTVWFVGDRAIKLLKPLRTAFVDHSTPERRAASIDRELALNRRIAPDVYLGTGLLREGEEVVDHLLVMRRMPHDRRLAALVRTPEGPARVREVARVVAAFHAGLPADPAAAIVAGPEGLARRWRADLDECDALDGFLDAGARAEVRRRAEDYLAGRRALLQHRVTAGWARDGHGDLLADDIFCLADGPRVLDCLAFDDDLRRGDVIADVAFLAMDLERIAGSAPAGQLWADYAEFLGERHPASLAHFHVAQRALVRAKVSAIRAGQLEGPAAEAAGEEAAARLDQCVGHLREGRARVVLVGGAPGTGKTTRARALADRMGWVRLSTDETRKELAGLSPLDRGDAPVGAGIYSEGMTLRTYEALLERAAELLGQGESVVLDATWARASDREAATAMAASARAELVAYRCVAPPEVVAGWVRRRAAAGGDASDADEEVAAALAARFEAWPAATEVGPGGDLPES